MKNTRYILIATLMFMVSCRGFLDEVSQDQFRPTRVEHYSAMLIQEFVSDPGVFAYVQFMTDEAAETPYEIKGGNKRNSYKPLITWQRNIELLDNGTTVTANNGAWGNLYHKIAIVNYIIEDMDNIEGTQQEKDFLLGEAYFIRSLCYFWLTNLYAEPYRDAQQARTTYGVPLKTDIGISPSHQKEMLDKCYELITGDLARARDLISRSGIETKQPYRPTVKACDLLSSRISLFKGDYEQTIKDAEKVINGSRLVKLNIIGEEGAVASRNNPEIIYSIGNRTENLLENWTMSDAGVVVNPALLDLYDESDQRSRTYFMKKENEKTGEISIYSRKAEYYKYADREYGFMNFRVAEAYLNRAEALARTGRYDQAREDLKELMSHRYLDINRIVIPSDDAELIGFIFDERFREFCFEDHHRWFDLRRMDEEMRPVIEHRFSLVDNNDNVTGIEYYTLLRNDRNYTLSVPIQEKSNNPLIRDYERYDKMPEYKGNPNY